MKVYVVTTNDNFDGGDRSKVHTTTKSLQKALQYKMKLLSEFLSSDEFKEFFPNDDMVECNDNETSLCVHDNDSYWWSCQITETEI